MAGDFPIIQFKFDFRLKCLALSFIAIALNDGEEVAENMKKPLPMLELENLVLSLERASIEEHLFIGF